MTTNLLGLEVSILERLRSQISDIDIGSSAAVAGAVDVTKICPFIFVEPDESNVGDSRQGRSSVETQLWIITLLVATVPDKRFQEATYQEAGEALGRIHDALRGWTPAKGCEPFVYAGRPKPDLRLGWAAFPIAFRCNVILR